VKKDEYKPTDPKIKFLQSPTKRFQTNWLSHQQKSILKLKPNFFGCKENYFSITFAHHPLIQFNLLFNMAEFLSYKNFVGDYCYYQILNLKL
jgi:hypothetical protein